MSAQIAKGRGATAVVVGVGPGLGLALANAFASHGYTVFAAARGEGLAQLAYSPGGRVIPQRCDATQPEQVERLFATAEAHGPVAATVFNAGTFERGDVVDTAPADFERCGGGCFAGFLVRSGGRTVDA